VPDIVNMPFIYQVTVAATLLALGLAAPIEERKNRGFSVPQVIHNHGFLTTGAHSVMKTYMKYGKAPPANVMSAAAASGGTVAATPEQYDSEYLCPVTIGGQTLRLDFDTGSSDL